MKSDLQALQEALAEPFKPKQLGWKPGNVSGARCLALPYIDARDVMGRLDRVVGCANWRDEYDFLPGPGGVVVCRLSLRLDGEWITKIDVGGESDQKDEGDRHKAAVSDALKRAAVKFGVGRYLYYIPPQWVDYDPQKKQITGTPKLPDWALPKAKDAAPPADEDRRELTQPELSDLAKRVTDAGVDIDDLFARAGHKRKGKKLTVGDKAAALLALGKLMAEREQAEAAASN